MQKNRSSTHKYSMRMVLFNREAGNLYCQCHVLTANISSGSCMVMQSILIWMVFPADLSVGLSVKLSSMGWIEWMADLQARDIYMFLVKLWFRYLQYNLLCIIDSLIQHIKQLVEYILAKGVRCLWWLIVGHGGEEWALSPRQARRGVSESAKRQEQPWP